VEDGLFHSFPTWSRRGIAEMVEMLISGCGSGDARSLQRHCFEAANAPQAETSFLRQAVPEAFEECEKWGGSRFGHSQSVRWAVDWL